MIPKELIMQKEQPRLLFLLLVDILTNTAQGIILYLLPRALSLPHHG